MKIELEIPDATLASAVRQVALDSILENRGFHNERLNKVVHAIVAEKTIRAISETDLSALISAVVNKCARETIEAEVQNVVAKIAREAVKAEMDKHGRLL